MVTLHHFTSLYLIALGEWTTRRIRIVLLNSLQWLRLNKTLLVDYYIVMLWSSPGHKIIIRWLMNYQTRG